MLHRLVFSDSETGPRPIGATAGAAGSVTRDATAGRRAVTAKMKPRRDDGARAREVTEADHRDVDPSPRGGNSGSATAWGC